MSVEAMNEIKQKFAKKLGVAVVDENASLKDLGLDSLDLVELLLELEDDYSIKFEAEEMTNYKTVRDLYSGIESKLN